MPTSNLHVWPLIVHYAWEAKPASVLDVGPGYGKGGLLLREYLGPLSRLDAVEAEARYLEDFPWLTSIYDEVHVADVTTMSKRRLGAYDLVLLVDVLEHLTHEQGEQLLARIPGRALVCTPRDFFQNPQFTDYPTEEHRSVWTVAEIEAVRAVETYDVGAVRELGAVLVRTAPLPAPNAD